MSRITKDGRHLTYEGTQTRLLAKGTTADSTIVKVIQQPERARACGSGAKCM